MKTHLAPRLSRPVAAPLDAAPSTRKAALQTGKIIDASPSGSQAGPHILDTFTPAIAYLPASSLPPAAGGVMAPNPNPAPSNGGPDVKYDGSFVGANGQTAPLAKADLSQFGVLPRDGTVSKETVVYVNGINTPLAEQQKSLQAIADKNDSRVIGIHNATEGTVKDLFQSVEDKAGFGKNPAVDSVKDLIRQEVVEGGRDLRLMGHSQGGLILSRALSEVRNELTTEQKLTPAQADRVLERVKVETFGAAAWGYPDGPEYVHYANTNDPVPSLFGQGASDFLRRPGRGAEVKTFTEGSFLDRLTFASHSFDNVYLPQRDDDFNHAYYDKPVVESAITKSLESGKPSTTAPQVLNGTDPAFKAEESKFVKGMLAAGLPPLQVAFTWSFIQAGLKLETERKPGAGPTPRNPYFEEVAKSLKDQLRPAPGQQPALWSGGYDTSKYAQSKGYTTLESTPAGKVLAGLELYKDPKAVTPLWDSLSEQFVKQIPQETPVHVFMRTHDPRSTLYQYEVPRLGGLENKNLRWHPLVGVDARSIREVQPGLKLGPSGDGYAKESEARTNLKNYYTQHPDAQKAIAADLMKLA